MTRISLTANSTEKQISSIYMILLSLQASFPQSFEEKHLFLWSFYFCERHTSDQSLKALTVSQLCFLDRKQPYMSKWPAPYSSELHLALSTVATLPQLSWGIQCLEAATISDLESGCQSKILVHPDESGKRHEIHNCVRKSLPWGWMPYRLVLTWTKDWYLRHSHPNSPELISGQQF